MSGPQPYAASRQRVATITVAGRARLAPTRWSFNAPAELFHKVDQLIDALRRHGVVDGRPHTTHQAVAFQVHKARLGGCGAERLVGAEASGLVKVTFIMLRYFFSTGFL